LSRLAAAWGLTVCHEERASTGWQNGLAVDDFSGGDEEKSLRPLERDPRPGQRSQNFEFRSVCGRRGRKVDLQIGGVGLGVHPEGFCQLSLRDWPACPRPVVVGRATSTRPWGQHLLGSCGNAEKRSVPRNGRTVPVVGLKTPAPAHLVLRARPGQDSTGSRPLGASSSTAVLGPAGGAVNIGTDAVDDSGERSTRRHRAGETLSSSSSRNRSAQFFGRSRTGCLSARSPGGARGLIARTRFGRRADPVVRPPQLTASRPEDQCALLVAPPRLGLAGKVPVHRKSVVLLCRTAGKAASPGRESLAPYLAGLTRVVLTDDLPAEEFKL